MKKPSCDCMPLGNESTGTISPCQSVYINRNWDDDGSPVYGKYLQLNFCPQCGQPWVEQEANNDN